MAKYGVEPHTVCRKLADKLYHRFFELAPDAQGLFRSDMNRDDQIGDSARSEDYFEVEARSDAI